MILSMYGTIASMEYLQDGSRAYAIATEHVGSHSYVVFHERLEAMWSVMGITLLGFLQLYPTEFLPLNGAIADLGLSVAHGEDVVLMIEAGTTGKWYLVYFPDDEGFWDMEEYVHSWSCMLHCIWIVEVPSIQYNIVIISYKIGGFYVVITGP